MFLRPIFESILNDINSKALYIFPLKALAQDQLKTIRNFSKSLNKNPKISAETYDGDTSVQKRKYIKQNLPNIILTNPDMLHTGILAYHWGWKSFFENLKFVVIDELHTYRGVFGSHTSNIFKRIRRIN